MDSKLERLDRWAQAKVDAGAFYLMERFGTRLASLLLAVRIGVSFSFLLSGAVKLSQQQYFGAALHIFVGGIFLAFSQFVAGQPELATDAAKWERNNRQVFIKAVAVWVLLGGIPLRLFAFSRQSAVQEPSALIALVVSDVIFGITYLLVGYLLNTPSDPPPRKKVEAEEKSSVFDPMPDSV